MTCKREHQKFIIDVIESLEYRYHHCTEVWLHLAETLTCLNFDLLVRVMCGRRGELEEGAIAVHKLTEFKLIYEYVSSLPHVRKAADDGVIGHSMDHRLFNRVYDQA